MSTPTSPDLTEIERHAKSCGHCNNHTGPLVAEVRRLRARLEMPCGSCHPCVNYGGSKERNDSLMAALTDVEADLDALRAAIQAVEKLCDEYRQNCDPTSRQAQVAEYFRAALVAAGADREDTEQPQPCPECASGSLLHALHGAGQVVPQQPTCDCYPDPRDHEPGCPVGQDT